MCGKENVSTLMKTEIYNRWMNWNKTTSDESVCFSTYMSERNEMKSKNLKVYYCMISMLMLDLTRNFSCAFQCISCASSQYGKKKKKQKKNKCTTFPKYAKRRHNIVPIFFVSHWSSKKGNTECTINGRRVKVSWHEDVT